MAVVGWENCCKQQELIAVPSYEMRSNNTCVQTYLPEVDHCFVNFELTRHWLYCNTQLCSVFESHYSKISVFVFFFNFNRFYVCRCIVFGWTNSRFYYHSYNLIARDSTRNRRLRYTRSIRMHEDESNVSSVIDCHWCDLSTLLFLF